MKILFQNYISGFFTWWYFVNLVELTRTMYYFWWGALEKLSLPSMLTNTFVPLYQDNSTLGKVFSFFIRLIWILVGLVVCTILSLLIFILFSIYLVLPFLPLFILFIHA